METGDTCGSNELSRTPFVFSEKCILQSRHFRHKSPKSVFLHKLPFAAAIKNLLFPVDFKHLSEEPSPVKSSVDMPYVCDILISQGC